MPIFHYDIEQGSADWDRLRLGIPTASEFAKIIMPIERKESRQWKDYAYRLLAERVIMRGEDSYTSEPMFRGKMIEDTAASWYEMNEDRDTTKVGFVNADVFSEDIRGYKWPHYGCSPDRLVGETGILEVKCCTAPVHMRYFIEQTPERKYWSQLQGQLFVCEREWVDILCFHEEMPKIVVRVERDETFIALLEGALQRINNYMDGVMDKIGETNLRQIAPKQELRRMLDASLGIVP